MKKFFSVLLAGVLVAASAISASAYASLYTYDSSDDEYWDAALGMLDKEGTKYFWTEDGAAAYYNVAVNTDTSTEMDGTDITNLESAWYEVVFCGLGSTEDEFPDDLDDKIAFVLRGDSTFTVKSENSANAGAVACIVGNNCRPDEAIDEDGAVTGSYENGNMSVDYETLPMCKFSSDASVKLVAEMTGTSVADTVAALTELANGATSTSLTGTQSAWLYFGTFEEYQANTTRTDANTFGGTTTTATTEEVAEEATTEEVAETPAEEVTEEVVETPVAEETVVVEETVTETAETVVEEAPQTFDFGVIAAAAAVVSAAGYAISKKR